MALWRSPAADGAVEGEDGGLRRACRAPGLGRQGQRAYPEPVAAVTPVVRLRNVERRIRSAEPALLGLAAQRDGAIRIQWTGGERRHLGALEERFEPEARAGPRRERAGVVVGPDRYVAATEHPEQGAPLRLLVLNVHGQPDLADAVPVQIAQGQIGRPGRIESRFAPKALGRRSEEIDWSGAVVGRQQNQQTGTYRRRGRGLKRVEDDLIVTTVAVDVATGRLADRRAGRQIVGRIGVGRASVRDADHEEQEQERRHDHVQHRSSPPRQHDRRTP